MIRSADFYRSILDSVTEQVVVIDETGAIKWVNQSWVDFGQQNGCRTPSDAWVSVNYLRVCDAATGKGRASGQAIAAGIRKVIEQTAPHFEVEYPCHSPGERRWFMMSVTPLVLDGGPFFAIIHKNITARREAEEKLRKLSLSDALTDLPNRRHFDNFLDAEWKRCFRLGLPISIALLDIDHFKLLNDHYGHQYGDECLATIGKTLNKIKKRPSDIFARFGGEEFALVFGNATAEQAAAPIERIMDEIRRLEIPNAVSQTAPHLTVSIGLAEAVPDDPDGHAKLVAAADDRLYAAKRAGRNRVVSS
jgi:diguanylate cyclase (GGDEF)-like protein